MPDHPRTDRSLPTLVTDLWELVRTYVRQETLAPLKGVPQFVAYGVAGSVMLSIGLVLLAMALLRALQTETGTAFDDNLSFLPYVITLTVCAFVVGLVALGMRKRGSRA